MNLKEQLVEKKAKLVELEPMLKADDVSAETVAEGEELVQAIADLENSIALAEKASDLLKTIGTESDNTISDDTEEKEMSQIQEFTEKAKAMVDRKAGVTMNFKAATDSVTAPQIADIDRSVAPTAVKPTVASLFSNVTISGNAITYFLQGAYEGTPAVTAQDAKKPQNSTSFTATTLALSKIAAYIKETDEILADAPFLASEVEGTLVSHLLSVENTTVVNAISNTAGILTDTYTDMADGILDAIADINDKSAFSASVVLMNPVDFTTLMKAKDQNGQYIGGGYFTGAYGNGSYQMPGSIWGLPVFTTSALTSGTVLVAAKEAVKIWKKGGVDVSLYQQNEDDALYNRVTLLAEERIACAVVDLNGVCKLTAQ